MVIPNVAHALLEEPDALIALVRVCGGVGGTTAGTTRRERGSAKKTQLDTEVTEASRRAQSDTAEPT
jgi:hypothetical protein